MRRGILLAQIGSPEAPTPEAVRVYLQKFLSDKRIVDYPDWVWQPILAMILKKRPAATAAKYAKIWTPQGSPLVVATESIADGLRKLLPELIVEVGLAYTNQEPKEACEKLQEAGCDEILVVPLYPEYSRTTTESVLDSVKKAHPVDGKKIKVLPALAQLKGYADIVSEHYQKQIEKIPGAQEACFLFSFHGIPLRYEWAGDDYRKSCHATAQKIAQTMGLKNYRVAFQSRFGPEPWVGPSTQKLLAQLPRAGVEKLIVATPGFVCDCIETLEEIHEEGLELWEKNGGDGKNFYPLKCLNAQEAWVAWLAKTIS